MFLDGKKLIAPLGNSHRGLVVWICVFILFLSSGTKAQEIHARFVPAQAPLGDSIALVIEVEGPKQQNPVLPQVDGLEFIPAGKHRKASMVNFQIHSESTYIYQVQPQKEGIYIIPPIRVMIGSSEYATDPLTLTVEPSGSSSAGNRNTSATQALASILGPLPHEDPDQPESGPEMPTTSSDIILSAEEKKKPLFIHMKLDKSKFFVGESIPIEFKLYAKMSTQFRLQSMPVVKGEAFALNQMPEKPIETRESIDGQPYRVLTWKGSISPIKAGNFPLQTSIATLVLIMEQSRPQNMTGSIWEDFFIHAIFRTAQPKHLELATEPQTIEVVQLPQEGRPDSFTGAIGQFQFDVAANPTTLEVGDPITLKMTLQGSGNFDRIGAPLFPENEKWKTYAPASQTVSSAPDRSSQTKQFQQAIIPKDPSVGEIPPIAFSYFDPDKQRYVTLASKPIALQLLPASATSTAINGLSESAQPRPESVLELAPAEIKERANVGYFDPLLSNPWFIGFHSLPLLAISVGLVLMWHQKRLRQDLAAQRKEQARSAIAGYLVQADEAAAVCAVQSFFEACRRAAQEGLGRRWHMEPSAITLLDLQEKMPEQVEKLGRLFEIADRVSYSGEKFSAQEMKQWKDYVAQELKNLGEFE